MAKDDILLAMYEEHVTQGREHEQQREKVTSVILVISAALLAFTSQTSWQPRHAILTTTMAVLGLFGILFSYKHYERNRFHVRIAQEFRDEIEKSSGVPIRAIRARAAAVHQSEYAQTSRWRLFVFWLLVPLVIFLLGAVLTWLILYRS